MGFPIWPTKGNPLKGKAGFFPPATQFKQVFGKFWNASLSLKTNLKENMDPHAWKLD